jgi:serpin B
MKAIRQIAQSRWPLLLASGWLVLLSVGSAPPGPVTREIKPEAKVVAEGNSRFALEVFSKLKDLDANPIVSPFSISCVLAMTYGGARGNTERQIAQTLHFSTNQLSFHTGMADLLASLTNLASRGEIELKLSNGLWPQSGYQIAPEFLNLCRNDYRADVDFVDFKAGAEPARRRINAWIEHSTKGKIGNLFTPGALNADTRMVLANAVYFKGKWASRFDKTKTRARPFWVTPEEAVQVPVMSQKSTFPYLLDGDTQILELPYRDGEISMIVLLPKERNGLLGLEQQLTSENLSSWIDRLAPANVDVLLPKFKMNSRFSLNQTLVVMGMPDGFDEVRADFTGMTAQRPFFINVVEHAAMVEVDEEGTVAAAATGMSFGCAKQPAPATFHADHPFIFLILDRSTRTLLFIGKVVNPGASKD